MRAISMLAAILLTAPLPAGEGPLTEKTIRDFAERTFAKADVDQNRNMEH